MKSKFVFWAGKILGAIVLIILIGVFIDMYLIPTLAYRFGVDTEARITEKEIDQRIGLLHVIAVNCDEGPQWVGTIIFIPSAVYDVVNANQMVAIRYLRSYPENPVLDISPPSLFQLFLLLFAILIIADRLCAPFKKEADGPAPNGAKLASGPGTDVVNS